MKPRLLVHVLITAGVLALFQFFIWQKQQVLARGATILLKLAPTDPRSLMQGDYMVLRYEVANEVPADSDGRRRGKIVVALDENGVAKFARAPDAQPLAPNEHLLKYYRESPLRVRLGAESFFFQEGEAERFAKARYGELKVAPDGSSVLAGLRDDSLQPIAAAPPAEKDP